MSAQAKVIDDRPKPSKPILVLDFDGVIHSYKTGWHGTAVCADPPTPGAMDALREYMKHFTVHIFSARSESEAGRRAMHSYVIVHYAAQHDLSFDQAVVELVEILWPTRKPHAFVSIDDRAIQFDGNWPEVGTLKSFKPWNRK